MIKYRIDFAHYATSLEDIKMMWKRGWFILYRLNHYDCLTNLIDEISNLDVRNRLLEKRTDKMREKIEKIQEGE